MYRPVVLEPLPGETYAEWQKRNEHVNAELAKMDRDLGKRPPGIPRPPDIEIPEGGFYG